MIADSVNMVMLAALGFGLAECAGALLARRTCHFELVFGVNLASVIAATTYAPFDDQIVHTSAAHCLTAGRYAPAAAPLPSDSRHVSFYWRCTIF